MTTYLFYNFAVKIRITFTCQARNKVCTKLKQRMKFDATKKIVLDIESAFIDQKRYRHQYKGKLE